MIFNQNIAVAGNAGGKIRSDCQVTLEVRKSGGIVVDLKSKVSVLYGTEMIRITKSVMDFFGIEHAHVSIDDSGSLNWVLSARLEAAVRGVSEISKTWLEPLHQNSYASTPRDRRRFSRLYLPGNSPSLMLNAFLHKPDGLILDLEDSVAPEKKDEARILVRNALRSIDFGTAERMVRINQLPGGYEDLDWVIPNGVNLILLPKCECAEQALSVIRHIEEIRMKNQLDVDVWIMPIIESAKGVVNAYEIASSSEKIAALAIGLEDYTADLGVRRTTEGNESLYARSVIVNAAKAAGIQAIDSVFSDVDDMEGLRQTVLRSRAMGFDGMGCIHPRQIGIINMNFAPDSEEIEKAKRIVMAFMDARKRGLGVVSLGSKMIDPPVVKRAQKTIDVAVQLNLLEENWHEKITL